MQVEVLDATSKLFSNYGKQRRKEICRLCGKTTQRHLSIFDENNMYIAEKISRCLPIIVLATDKLPSYVCEQCLNHLNISYKLIITATEIDALLRKKLNESKTRTILESQKTNNSSECVNVKKPNTNKNLSLKELTRRAIAGPAECEICNKVFHDVDVFDHHMEVLHLLEWRCNLCDDSFETSMELISHKTVKHNGDITICKTCVNTRKQDSTPVVETGQTINHSIIGLETTDQSEVQIENVESSNPRIHAPEVIQESGAKKQKKRTTLNKKRRPNSNSLQKSKSNKEKKTSMFFCDVCQICFGDEHHFNAHKKIHGPKRMHCMLCAAECPSIYDLFLHKRAEHNLYKKVQLKYVCDQCGKFFTNSWQWESHKVNNCPKKPPEYSCKYCKCIFSTNHKLMRHLRRHRAEMFNDPSVFIYRCVTCPKVFVDKEFYQKHRNVHDPECWDSYKCTLCDRPFRDNLRLKEHMLSIHEGVKPHRCDICDKTFYRSYNMKLHRTTHFGHKCSYCNTNFERLSDLMKHVRDDHGVEPEVKRLSSRPTYTSSTYICRYCGKKLASYQSLINHEHIHTGERPYACKICHKTFRNYTTRWAHAQRHMKGTFVCEHCGKCFSYKQNLRIHILTHLPMEARKHECSECGKRFVRKCQLNIHMRVHDGTRPYTCDICLLSFTQKGDMRRHRSKHTIGHVQLRSSRRKTEEST